MVLLATFTLWTALVQMIDVQPLGQKGTNIGFATLNCQFHYLTGVHMGLYTVTDWMGLVPVMIGFIFASLGLVQLVRRKSLAKVDFDLILLGIYYLVVIWVYAIFEAVPVNYRPILLDGRLEASYPSSTTLLVLCVMLAFVDQVHRRISPPCHTKNTHGFSLHFFYLYGYRQTNCRRPLVYGYCWRGLVKYRLIHHLQDMYHPILEKYLK